MESDAKQGGIQRILADLNEIDVTRLGPPRYYVDPDGGCGCPVVELARKNGMDPVTVGYTGFYTVEHFTFLQDLATLYGVHTMDIHAIADGYDGVYAEIGTFVPYPADLYAAGQTLCRRYRELGGRA